MNFGIECHYSAVISDTHENSCTQKPFEVKQIFYFTSLQNNKDFMRPNDLHSL